MSDNSWQDTLNSALKSQGLENYGLTPIATPVSIEFYQNWIDQGHHAEMSYLKDHIEQKSDATSLLKRAKTVISVLAPYEPHPQPIQLPIKAMKVARYARGADYHHWLQEKMQDVANQLKHEYPDEEFLCFTDSKPLLEKEWAAKNNLGWIGKNSLLLNQKLGSLFFLSEIITTMTAEDSQATFSVPDLCGKCTACIEHCPTAAILDDRSLDARKCLAYWNIEAKTPAPKEIRENYEGWLFGCDICQEVCPWNKKVFQKQTEASSSDGLQLQQDLTYILTSSNKRLQKDFAATPLTRAGGKGLKRSALCIIGGWRIASLSETLQSLSFDNEDLESLRKWALDRCQT